MFDFRNHFPSLQHLNACSLVLTVFPAGDAEWMEPSVNLVRILLPFNNSLGDSPMQKEFFYIALEILAKLPLEVTRDFLNACLNDCIKRSQHRLLLDDKCSGEMYNASLFAPSLELLRHECCGIIGHQRVGISEMSKFLFKYSSSTFRRR